MNHLGSLTIYFCWIVLISGIWLIIFFRTSVAGAFESLEYLSREQWYLGGIMRSLHRYASDAAVLLLALHVIKEFSFDRYRPKRWFSWITGLPLVWIVFPLGITGYWLVWDKLAQYVAITSAELLDRLPIFTDSMAGNFLSDAALSDRFFTLMAFLHLIGLPIFLVFGIWLHVFRLSRPEINPPRRLMAGALLAMLMLSLVFPAQSQDRANLALAPQILDMDWFYLHFYPLVQIWSPGWVWFTLVAVSVLILLAPWLPPGRKELPAVVSLDNCNGCQRCADDCPYGAIQMAPRSDGTSYLREAVVDSDLCVSCGICVGACPTASPFRTRSELVPGIDLPSLAASELRVAIGNAAENLVGKDRVLAFACRGSRDAQSLSAAGEALVQVQCMGQIPPAFFDYVLSRNHADGIFLAGCTDQGCRYRLGSSWTGQRIGRTRDPRLRKRIDTRRIALGWTDSPDGSVLRRLQAFRKDLQRQSAESAP
jgi:ferredoxin/coenzyme F420-reducing hydrogenase delta subunit